MNLLIIAIIILIVFLIKYNIKKESFKEIAKNTEKRKQKFKIYKSTRSKCFDCEKESTYSYPSKCFKCEKPLPKLKKINKYSWVGKFLQR